MKHRTVLVGLLLAGCAAFAGVLGLTQGQAAAQQAASVAMAQKMEASKQLLEGIALRDFSVITDSAESLRKISLEAQWIEGDSRLYGEHGKAFRAGLAAVTDAAESENLEGVTLQYMQVVMSCVQCHEAVRENQQIALAPIASEVLRAR